MQTFVKEDFLLTSQTSLELYNKIKDTPIFDYHCHLDAKEIYENKVYENITKMWLHGDHYKYRALRTLGIEEKYITGDADDFEKFRVWIESIPKFIGNPLYHWAHLEIKRYLGYEKTLDGKNAKELYEYFNNKIKMEKISPVYLLQKSNVKFLCTTNDPIEDLKYHKLIEGSSVDIQVNPTFRPDKIMKIYEEGFEEYLQKLEQKVNFEINTLEDFEKAIVNRVKFYKEAECFITDHSLEMFRFLKTSKEEVEAIFLNRQELTSEDIFKYQTYILLFLNKEYAKNDMAVQFHIGALRNVSQKKFEQLGVDLGFDCIDDKPFIEDLAKLLSQIQMNSKLPNTIIYTLNPKENDAVASLIGCFQGQSNIQFGSAWWFNDQKDGITRQLTALMSMGLISTSIGMLTDSRSFMSYTRHEYFRRILCDLFGKMMEEEVIANDFSNVEFIIKSICYDNAKSYFNK